MNNRLELEKGLRLEPVIFTNIDQKGELEVLNTDGKLNYHNGTSASPVVTESHTATLTNKTISGNTATNLVSGSGTLIVNTTGTVTIPNTTDTLVGKATTDIFTNKTIDGDVNTVQDLPLTALKTNLADASTFIVRDASGIPVSGTKAVPTGVVIGTTDTQVLTNKTIDADLNTITNIENADIKAGAAIDASKLADGTVSNAEFQFINTLTSNAQTQIDTKVQGPATSTDNSVARFDGTNVKVIQGSGVIIDDSNNIATPGTIYSGAGTIDVSARLQADSTSQGFLPPRLTTTQRDAISTPATGLLIFNTSDGQYNFYNGAAWTALESGTSSAFTGMTVDYTGSTEPTGWVFGSGLTIGNASSGATGRANADTLNLFTLLWNSFANAELAVSGGRGGSAAADYAANKNIALPDLRGRVTVGKDNMGGSTAGRMTAASSGITGTTLGSSGGTEVHTLTINQMPSHNHVERGASAGGVATFIQRQLNVATDVDTNSMTGFTGGGVFHQNTQPSYILNKIIKL